MTGLAETVADAGFKARYLAVHPYAALYAGFGDFALWRIRPLNGLFVGGFARAARLRAADLTPDPVSVAAIVTAEADIIAHCNADHPDAMAAIARAPGAWRMVGVDVDGCDLAQGEHVVRVAWPAPVEQCGRCAAGVDPAGAGGTGVSGRGRIGRRRIYGSDGALFEWQRWAESRRAHQLFAHRGVLILLT